MKRFNIRVYAIIINDRNEVLISDEFEYGFPFTKFPGGGLEWGEGTVACLKRELMEELGLEAEIGELVYVNDYFQLSQFRDTDQLLSFYYKVTEIDFERIPISSHVVPLSKPGEAFRWVPIDKLSEQMLTFPVDQKVVEKVKKLL